MTYLFSFLLVVGILATFTTSGRFLKLMKAFEDLKTSLDVMVATLSEDIQQRRLQNEIQNKQNELLEMPSGVALIRPVPETEAP